MDALEIDYSEIPHDAINPVTTKKWRPPPHVYFGPKDAEGSMLPEPVYEYQEFPRMMYMKREDKISAKIAYNDQDKAGYLEAGYVLTLAELGYKNAPSFEELQEMAAKQQAEAAAEESPRRGRPPKA